ncbi:hypothetical protein CAPTEDRAFT_224306 [Capitella teleta]|uniref:Uncharacterized protein n=1 Tax=Capitella teleta TaxID=283909 RepID=R7TJL2_CAPTE|nr:hypothetical protein CAPTEDRAFT_224306 [Capitella teleta]|eukprot:ELT91731.1 hypothetical protein CAPTEDRAFT_224306 [Capitella teleta]
MEKNSESSNSKNLSKFLDLLQEGLYTSLLLLHCIYSLEVLKNSPEKYSSVFTSLEAALIQLPTDVSLDAVSLQFISGHKCMLIFQHAVFHYQLPQCVNSIIQDVPSFCLDVPFWCSDVKSLFSFIASISLFRAKQRMQARKYLDSISAASSLAPYAAYIRAASFIQEANYLDAMSALDFSVPNNADCCIKARISYLKAKCLMNEASTAKFTSPPSVLFNCNVLDQITGNGTPISHSQALYLLAVRNYTLKRYSDSRSAFYDLILEMKKSGNVMSNEGHESISVGCLCSIFHDATRVLLLSRKHEEALLLCDHALEKHTSMKQTAEANQKTLTSEETPSSQGEKRPRNENANLCCLNAHLQMLVFKAESQYAVDMPHEAILCAKKVVDQMASEQEEELPSSKRHKSDKIGRHTSQTEDTQLLSTAYEIISIACLRVDQHKDALHYSRLSVVNSQDSRPSFNHTCLLVQMDRTQQAFNFWSEFRDFCGMDKFNQANLLDRKSQVAEVGMCSWESQLRITLRGSDRRSSPTNGCPSLRVGTENKT